MNKYLNATITRFSKINNAAIPKPKLLKKKKKKKKKHTKFDATAVTELYLITKIMKLLIQQSQKNHKNQ